VHRASLLCSVRKLTLVDSVCSPCIDTCVYCCLVVAIGIKDQSLAPSAEVVSREFGPETFGCLQITVISLTLQI
jgi:hypothetical protein